MELAKTLEGFFEKHENYKAEIALLREILLSTTLEESLKWGAPGYTLNGKNVIGIGAFKSYVGLWFHQGVFLMDEAKQLENAQEGKTRGMRQWRFHSLEEIIEKRDLIKSYVIEAIENQKAGKVIVNKKKTSPVVIHETLRDAFDKNKAFATAFESLSMGKRREYANYINEAKREATRLSRLEKIIPMIQSGIGLNDKYR